LTILAAKFLAFDDAIDLTDETCGQSPWGDRGQDGLLLSGKTTSDALECSRRQAVRKATGRRE